MCVSGSRLVVACHDLGGAETEAVEEEGGGGSIGEDWKGALGRTKRGETKLGKESN